MPLVGMPFVLAYLDPATGSLLVSLVVGGTAAAFFLLKGLLHRGRSRLLRLLGQHEAAPEEEHALVLYSEGRQYAGTFRPLVAELARRRVPCLYLTSDAEDPLLEQGAGSIATRMIGKSYASWAYLNSLRAKVCVMTTPGLDVMQIKRSRHVRHYAHLIHAPTDKAFNRPYSFDYFDSVFLCGRHQERTIRTLEALRRSRTKKLVEAGCVYYDELAASFSAGAPEPDKGKEGPLRVLVGPTWGKNGLFSRFGLRPLLPLIEAGFEVTVRPHPQSRSAEAELFAGLERETAAFENLRWDHATTPQEAMQWADILVSDISGLIFDFCFLTGRPVVTLALVPEKRGFEASDLPYEPWELEMLDVVGRRIDEADFAELPEILRQEAGDSSRKERIRSLREEFVVNFGCAAVPVVDELVRLVEAESAPSSLAA